MERFLLLALFGIGMAHMEGMTVVYLRRALGIDDTLTNKDAVEKIPKQWIFIEQTREVATIVMLVAIALLVGTTWLDKVVVFLWTFAFWDLFYYLSLYLVIKWPPKFTTRCAFSYPSPLDCTGLVFQLVYRH